MPEVDPKWAKVPPEELHKYVEQSPQKPGESDTDWAVRNQMYELKLLATYGDGRDEPVVVNMDLAGEGTVSGGPEDAG
jgi:hemolysin-activating ACP:hemolysin acyltransferase